MKILNVFRRRIGNKIIFGFGLISILLLFVGFYGFNTIRNIKIKYTLISTKSLPAIQQLENMKFECLRLISSATEFAFIKNESKGSVQPESLNEEDNLMKAACTSCHKAFSEFRLLVDTSFSETKEHIRDISSKGIVLQIVTDKFIESSKLGMSGTEAIESKEELEVAEMDFLETINNTISFTNNRLDQEKVLLDSTISTSLRIILILSIMAILLSVLISIRLTSSFSKPISNLTKLHEDFRDGNMNIVAEIKTFDEIGVLGRSFNEMAMRIKQLVMELEKEIKATRQAEELMKVSNNQKKTILDVAGEGIIGLDLDGNHTFINPMAYEILGFNDDELLGKHSHTLFHHSYPDGTFYPDHKCPIYITLKDGKKHNGEEYFWKKDGSGIPVVFSSLPIIENNNITGAIVTFRDISDIKHIQEVIKKSNEELKKVVAEKDKFLSIIAHDLRSPFNIFLGYTQMLAEELPDLTMDSIQKITGNMRKVALTTFDLLENLLLWAKSQQTLIPFKPLKISLLNEVEEIMDKLMEHARSKDILVNISISNDLMVSADRNMLQTILRNLVSNALKFTPVGGQIIISAIIDNNSKVLMSVKDSGIGMSKEMLNSLFQLDSQINRKGTNGEPSSGLGLLICKDFIEKHGGKIVIESEEGKGSNFTFNLPVFIDSTP